MQKLLDSAPIWRRIKDHHTEPEDAGRVVAETRAKMAVFTHVVALTNGQIPPVGADEIMARIAPFMTGPSPWERT